MPLDAATVLSLAATCAPGVAPATLLAVARVESGLDPLAIGVNGPARETPRPRDAQEAVRAAQSLIRAGRNVDLGLSQINSRNLPALGLSLADAFDPCTNLRASARILAAGYRAAPSPSPQARLRVALSVYNTGHPERGFANGYVAKVVGAAGFADPLLAIRQPTLKPVRVRAAWSVFAGSPDAADHPFVLSFSTGDRP
ncbi:MAG: hypothetical protein A2790_19920 [Phenylobacterium sp. RIFCSPHIGHO2_01_FULL_69_31]|uniref:lytic transglycosylase domain-containing protein n=1 Tax=Phenylobacterium sp. RIFCSPHIGHO2_01_FULL_69_31 TaxID=1801944 RepID=UPI0008CC83C4|nr:lytic transglycosylase domain-containing protein [Phenylobacterium sp. RIFCSPHIGHO2_01_FULL_69_31]OHB26239.1 MAG: hypothetical protein A2790_19920 [Phenylobacterium sp. RIFCSPHIGHO2_01_FULL_69_31]